jgi:molybdopterin-binding protein
VPVYRIRDAAELLGVSDDTLRRWADSGRVGTVEQPDGPRAIDGQELARLATTLGDHEAAPMPSGTSARNRLRGIVTRVTRDTVMAQVDMQCGPYRLVSLMSREAADDLGLSPGVLAVASIKSTNVVVELPADEH